MELLGFHNPTLGNWVMGILPFLPSFHVYIFPLKKCESPNFFIKISFIFIWSVRERHTLPCRMHNGGQRTAWKSDSSPIMWVLRLHLKQSVLVSSALIHWAFSPAQFTLESVFLYSVRQGLMIEFIFVTYGYLVITALIIEKILSSDLCLPPPSSYTHTHTHTHINTYSCAWIYSGVSNFIDSDVHPYLCTDYTLLIMVIL